MTKVNVDVIEAQVLAGDSELNVINGAYLQLCILNPSIYQRQTTKQHSGSGISVSFGESFEFDANETDDLEIKLCDDEFLWGEKLCGTRIPLKEVFEMGGNMNGWFPLGEDMRGKTSGKVLLNIHIE
jgi:hypothetical protein